MNKVLFLLIPLFLLSCKKDTALENQSENHSVTSKEIKQQSPLIDSAKIEDTANNSAIDAEDTAEKDGMRQDKDHTILRMVDGQSIPLTIKEEFTKDHDKLILKIFNYKKSTIKAKIITNQKDFNIRFNQIKLEDGQMDGPFGRQIEYKIPNEGEIWLIIGKNLMAEGKTIGSFLVSVE